MYVVAGLREPHRTQALESGKAQNLVASLQTSRLEHTIAEKCDSCSHVSSHVSENLEIREIEEILTWYLQGIKVARKSDSTGMFVNFRNLL